VLVCDDTDSVRTLIAMNLELEGYDVVQAHDGLEALDILSDTSTPLPDVVTVDALMPRRDGWWTVSMIRTDPRLQHLPVVMVTASVQRHHRAQADPGIGAARGGGQIGCFGHVCQRTLTGCSCQPRLTWRRGRPARDGPSGGTRSASAGR
jgi:CheY-like chemotaxis protein